MFDQSESYQEVISSPLIPDFSGRELALWLHVHVQLLGAVCK